MKCFKNKARANEKDDWEENINNENKYIMTINNENKHVMQGKNFKEVLEPKMCCMSLSF